MVVVGFPMRIRRLDRKGGPISQYLGNYLTSSTSTWLTFMCCVRYPGPQADLSSSCMDQQGTKTVRSASNGHDYKPDTLFLKINCNIQSIAQYQPTFLFFRHKRSTPAEAGQLLTPPCIFTTPLKISMTSRLEKAIMINVGLSTQNS